MGSIKQTQRYIRSDNNHPDIPDSVAGIPELPGSNP